MVLQLCDLYENDSIFDKFECSLSGDGLHVATGSYRFVFLDLKDLLCYCFKQFNFITKASFFNWLMLIYLCLYGFILYIYVCMYMYAYITWAYISRVLDTVQYRTMENTKYLQKVFYFLLYM
jgi:hypothetical protein